MIRRDLIKDQIEQLGRALGKVITNFFGLKGQGKVSEGIEITNSTLKSELDLDIDTILNLKGTALSEYIRKRMLADEHIEKLADYLTEVGMHTMTFDKGQAKHIFEKILELYGIIDATSSTISFERMNKEATIKNALQKCQ